MKLCEIDDKYSLINYVREDIYDSYRMKVILEDLDQKFFRPWSRYLEEAQLQPGQAEELFKKIQQTSNAGGANSTLIGKAVEKIMPASMLQKLHDSIPEPDPNAQPDPQFEQKATASIQKLNVDAETKQGLMKVVDSGKKNPVSQAVILAVVGGVLGGVLTKAAPFITTMTGGSGTVAMAITGALVAGTVSVAAAKIQGKSWKDAFKGAIKPALAGAAGAAIGSLARGFIGNMGTSAAPALVSDNDYKVQPGDTLSQLAQDNDVSVKDLMTANPDITDPNKIAAGQDIKIPAATGNPIYQDGVGTGGPGSQPATTTTAEPTAPGAATSTVSDVQTSTSADGSGTTTSGTLQGVTGEQIRNHPEYQAEIEKFGDDPQSRQAASMKARAAILRGESQLRKGRRLSEGQIYLICSKIEKKNNVMLSEGYLILEEPKKPGFLSRAGAFLKTKAQNITQKVTADKLTRAWKDDGSKQDSNQIADFLKGQGVNDQVIADVYKEMNLPAPAGAPAATDATSSSTDQTPNTTVQARIDSTPQGFDAETGKPNPVSADGEEQPSNQPQPTADDNKPQQNQEVDLDGKKYRWLGAQWAEVNPSTNKAGQIAQKGIVPELNKLAAQPADEQDSDDVAGDTGTPATVAPTGPQSGQEIEMPGTSNKYKYTPQWLDNQGKPAPEAVAKVLSQLSSGTSAADLPLDDIRNARRAVGLTASKINHGQALKENRISIFRKQ